VSALIPALVSRILARYRRRFMARAQQCDECQSFAAATDDALAKWITFQSFPTARGDDESLYEDHDFCSVEHAVIYWARKSMFHAKT
jgi:hypothetical protein